ncbi:hypothetical protein BOTBODRAFT_455368 [Botryobasidium botryosum FD-172 SS1]|uniref:Uncharacterized protein n=1 Tax=Botryobasidium botryosum (strain FD-172 SS1) TaxID=930990 RepID=A0A067MHS9_BOTB1|nr:hypothetical protein BOTBODRAFT_455368 [Botryobasidium botryosum FD-172 SS1]
MHISLHWLAHCQVLCMCQWWPLVRIFVTTMAVAFMCPSHSVFIASPGILIVAAQLFWHAHGKRPTVLQMREVISLYLTSGKANAVRAQVGEELGNLTGYYTGEYADVVIKIVMENQLGGH